MNQQNAIAHIEALKVSLRTAIIPPHARQQLDQLEQELRYNSTAAEPQDPINAIFAKAALGLGDLTVTLAKVINGYGSDDSNWLENDTKAVDLAQGLASQAGMDPKFETADLTITDTQYRLPLEVVEFITARQAHDEFTGDQLQQAHESAAALGASLAEVEERLAALTPDDSQRALYAGMLLAWAGRLAAGEQQLLDPTETADAMRQLASLLAPQLVKLPAEGQDGELAAWPIDAPKEDIDTGSTEGTQKAE